MSAAGSAPDPAKFRPFAHLATPHAALYLRVMLAFVAAKRRFVVHLRSEDVQEELGADDPAPCRRSTRR